MRKIFLKSIPFFLIFLISVFFIPKTSAQTIEEISNSIIIDSINFDVTVLRGGDLQIVEKIQFSPDFNDSMPLSWPIYTKDAKILKILISFVVLEAPSCFDFVWQLGPY